MKQLLLCIDLQNVYLKGNEWECIHSERTIRNIEKLLESGVFQSVVFTRFVPPVSPEGAWKEYNAIYESINSSAYLNDMIEDMKPYLKTFPLYDKSVFSSLSSEPVRKAVKEADRVVVTGFVAECCVLSTVFSLIDEGKRFVYIEDAISGLTEESEIESRNIVSYFTPLHGFVSKTNEYLKDCVKACEE